MRNLQVVCTKCGAYANLPCAYHYHECVHPERWEVPAKPEEKEE